jgi:ribonuclease P protein component
MGQQSFRRSDRIRRQREFDRVYGEEAYAADQVLVVRACRNELGRTRLGLSVSRKVGNAVVRNRWKRLIREAFRLRRALLPVGLDVVVRPRRGAEPDLESITASLPNLVIRVSQRLEGTRR